MNKYSVFYIEDDEDDMLIFEDALLSIPEYNEQSVKLYICENGYNFLKFIEKDEAENKIVFLDINMPAKSGFDYLRELRTDQNLKNLPVVTYSTSYDRNFINKSRELGANYYAIKPSKFGDLTKLISKAIRIDFDRETAPPNDFIFNLLVQ
ncbi:response regulator [Cytophaga sp. FL35]|uniref:response regulator n=1 Tax=Cytophaga sp. FL35 TaxID=1904456 RepID=UPI001653876B|nr:response regulator [Cytophaga sp. FL35]MBC7000731.1 response regulator [Cytophaga sp. FL35]